MTATEAYASRLRLSNYLREPALQAAIAALQLPAGSRGLDAGCGIGLHTALLAQAVGPAGHVTGLDLSPDFLTLAEQYAGGLDLSCRTSFRQGDVNCLPFEDDAFDWAWSVDTVYAGPVGDPVAITRELARVVKPGGLVALLFWSGQKLLPGYPVLEARLDAQFALTAPYLAGIPIELQYTGAPGWLRLAGLEDRVSRTFTADICAPLAEETRSALAMTFEMLWSGASLGLSEDDQTLFRRLCSVDSPDCVLNTLDYCGSVTYSLFAGRVSGR